MTEIKNPSIIDFSDIDDDQMNALIDGTLTDFDEGDLVDGTVVKIEHDEVLVDIGFKSEGVIPLRELSIRKDADPSDIVNLGDKPLVSGDGLLLQVRFRLLKDGAAAPEVRDAVTVSPALEYRYMTIE